METTVNSKNKSSSKNQQYGQEGSMTKAIESQTEKIPSGLFLVGGISAAAGSLILKSCGMHKTANFVAQWTPTVLILGLYNKLVKVEGSEGEKDQY